jgi:predicted RNA-binding protein with PIN domain
MPILIDGWNLIRCEKSGIRDLEIPYLESADALLASLSDFQTGHRDPITVVFDSKREFLDIGFRPTAMLKVVAAKDADDYIRRAVERIPEKQRRNLRVVSSDNSVYYHVRSLGATPVRTEEFWKKMRSWRSGAVPKGLPKG